MDKIEETKQEKSIRYLRNLHLILNIQWLFLKLSRGRS